MGLRWPALLEQTAARASATAVLRRAAPCCARAHASRAGRTQRATRLGADRSCRVPPSTRLHSARSDLHALSAQASRTKPRPAPSPHRRSGRERCRQCCGTRFIVSHEADGLFVHAWQCSGGSEPPSRPGSDSIAHGGLQGNKHQPQVEDCTRCERGRHLRGAGSLPGGRPPSASSLLRVLRLRMPAPPSVSASQPLCLLPATGPLPLSSSTAAPRSNSTRVTTAWTAMRC